MICPYCERHIKAPTDHDTGCRDYGRSLPHYEEMTDDDFYSMLDYYRRAKLQYGNRAWEPLALKNYDRLLIMENNLVLGFLSTHPKFELDSGWIEEAGRIKRRY